MRLVLFLALWPSAASAATLDVCSTCAYTTIGSALTAAASGDTVTVAAGTYTEAVSLTKDVSLVGAGAGTTTITSTTNPPLAVSGTTAATVSGFTVEPVDSYDQAVTVVGAVVAFDDLAITDVFGSSYGQCMAVTAASTVTMSDSTFTNCDGYAGGAIYASASTLSLVSTTITTSYAAYGGGIYAINSAVELTDSSFTDNSAYDIGGHVYLYTSTLVSTRVAFDQGKSIANDAGAVYAYLGSWTDTDSTVTNGTTYSCGGGAWLNTTTFTARGTSFTGNTAECGGALRTYYTTVDLADVTFDGNSSTATSGGHIHAEGGAVTITGASFTSGSAVTVGGAIYRAYGTTTIADSTFDTHSAGYGGTIYATTPTSFLLDAVTMTGGDAVYQGGHIYALSGPLDVVDSTFAYGTGVDAGGIVQVYGSLDVSGSSFSDHTATGWGGAIYPYYAPFTVTDTTFARNAAVQGGHLMVYGSAAGVTGATFDEGAATIGSAVMDYYGAMTISGSRFEGNAASSYGTVVALSAPALDIEDSAFVGNSAVEWHGGAHWRLTPGSVARTTFEGNEGGAGGGGVAIWADGNVEVEDCTFTDNNAGQGGAIAWYGYSGGLGQLSISGSSFDGNTADGSDGGAIYVQSGGDLVMAGNTLSGNSALVRGGGVAVITTDSVAATANTLCGNSAVDGGGAWLGTITPSSDHGWRANVFVENVASGKGGGAYVTAAAGFLWNNDFLANEAVNGGGLYTDSNVNLKNNLVAWTVAGNGLETTSAVTTATASVSYNDFYSNGAADVAGGITTIPATNVTFDPDLASYTVGDGCAGDFKLAAGSLLRDAGDPSILDTDGSRSDIGAFGGPSATAVDSDGDGAYDDTDCDDTDATVLPGAVETCDDVDDDCDGRVDDSAIDAATFYLDEDGDGYGGEMSVEACDPPADAYAASDDCDDFDPDVSPIALEACNGIDDDCDGDIDEDAYDPLTWHADADGDGHGDPSDTQLACDAPDGYVAGSDDCDDTAADVFPGADETCDARDQDCDGAIDEDPVDGVWYADADGDGFGAGDPVVGCDQPVGYTATAGDCDDAAIGAHPGAEDIPADGIDQDCDGSDAEVEVGDSTRDWVAPEEEDEIIAAGCGCSGVGGSPVWAAALLALTATRRRRPARPAPR